jgi:hypothetical protein
VREVALMAEPDRPADHAWPVEDDDVPVPYEPPVIVRLGRVRDLVKGSSSSGSADANSQYYW